jgi:hypothetical protein
MPNDTTSPFPRSHALVFISSYMHASIHGVLVSASSLISAHHISNPHTRTALAPLHLNLLNPLALPFIACVPHAPLVKPISPSNLPTSFPQAYPALKLIAENTSTTPAEIIHVISVGLISISSSYAVLGVALRVFFASRSLLCSRAFRFDAWDLGDEAGE